MVGGIVSIVINIFLILYVIELFITMVNFKDDTLEVIETSVDSIINEPVDYD